MEKSLFKAHLEALGTLAGRIVKVEEENRAIKAGLADLYEGKSFNLYELYQLECWHAKISSDHSCAKLDKLMPEWLLAYWAIRDKGLAVRKVLTDASVDWRVEIFADVEMSEKTLSAIKFTCPVVFEWPRACETSIDDMECILNSGQCSTGAPYIVISPEILTSLKVVVDYEGGSLNEDGDTTEAMGLFKACRLNWDTSKLKLELERVVKVHFDACESLNVSKHLPTILESLELAISRSLGKLLKRGVLELSPTTQDLVVYQKVLDLSSVNKEVLSSIIGSDL